MHILDVHTYFSFIFVILGLVLMFCEFQAGYCAGTLILQVY